jgi:tetratricopeptide (TPR) repeat protein
LVLILAAVLFLIRAMTQGGPRHAIKHYDRNIQQLKISGTHMVINAGYLESSFAPDSRDMIAYNWFTNIVCHRDILLLPAIARHIPQLSRKIKLHHYPSGCLCGQGDLGHNLPMRLLIAILFSTLAFAQHDHPAPEKLGAVDFSVSCTPGAQARFVRGVALLHSFAYSESGKQFQSVLSEDPNCAMANWGLAMSYYQQLWEPPLNPTSEQKGRSAIDAAVAQGSKSAVESDLIAAVARLYDDPKRPVRERMAVYESDMGRIAALNPQQVEVQVFYALALLSTAPPTDRTHRNQKKAVAILEPLYAKYPQHPGIVHYLIHAYDNSEMAAQGIKAAREYSQIAPSAPHALHMPSHIFTREGMWTDSVQSNLAARKAAHDQGDVGEELHAMDYLTYAYLQLGHYDEAAAVLGDLKKITDLSYGGFKVGYAATAMPVRYAVEQKKWGDASALPVLDNAPPQVKAITVWARSLGFARAGGPTKAEAEAKSLVEMEGKLRAAKNSYWADQVAILRHETDGWIAQACGDLAGARRHLTAAADLEDSLEKLPLTPGPIVPAREQLGELLLASGQSAEALGEFERSLKESPGRRNALQGAAQAAKQSGNKAKAEQYRAALQGK